MGKTDLQQHWPAYLITIGAVIAVLARLLWADVHNRFDNTSLILFAIGGVALLLPHVLREIPHLKKFKYGDAEIEFRHLEQELRAVSPSGLRSLDGEGRALALPSSEHNEKSGAAETVQPEIVSHSQSSPASLRTAEDWSQYRESVKQLSRDVFLAHVIKPSSASGQKYDIFIFLARTQPSNFEDVSYAEFFFGRYWGNQVFKVSKEGGRVGVSTAAYGPFLAVCRVTFEDGHQALLERLIDFEMGRIFEAGER